MARPISIDDEQLLSAAREVFLEKGISATTAEIAARAGVAEGTLFHRFGNKVALFNAALRPDGGNVLKRIGLAAKAGQGELEETLFEVLQTLIDFLRGAMPRIMMSWSNRGESGLPSMLEGENPPPLAVLRELALYFEAETHAGRIRAVDPEIMARACAAGAIHFVFIETLGAFHGSAPMPQSMYVRGLVDLLLKGALPAASPSPPARSSRKPTPPR
jgi:AcrR family transcriptional regulator